MAFWNASLRQPQELISPIPQYEVLKHGVNQEESRVLAVQVLDLSERDEGQFINQVYKDNILLAFSFLTLQEWNSSYTSGKTGFILQPGEVFCFHENISGEFKGKEVKTMGTKFQAQEGYRSSGWVYGDGVCHLASLIHWTAVEAGLEITARVKHNFRPIPGIPEKYWTSIRYCSSGCNSQSQNLYVTNTHDFPVEFKFSIEGEKLELEIISK